MPPSSHSRSRSKKSSQSSKKVGRSKSNSSQKRSRQKDRRVRSRSRQKIERSKRSRSDSSNRYRKKRGQVRNVKNKKLFITNIQGNIPQSEVRAQLKKQFETFGKIAQITVKTKVNSSNTYAFIEFQWIQDSVKAQQEMNLKMFKGKELKVQFGKTFNKQSDQQGSGCFYCHKDGHYARECQQKNKFDRRGRDNHDDRKRSRSRDKHHRKSRRSHSRRSSSSDHKRYRNQRKRNSRSPPYQPRKRYDRNERDDRDRRRDRDRSPRFKQY